MECATMAAVAQFRNKVFGQILYSGDILPGGRFLWWPKMVLKYIGKGKVVYDYNQSIMYVSIGKLDGNVVGI